MSKAPQLHLSQYVRDKDGNPFACLLAKTESKDHPFYEFGYSVCVKQDTFSKKKAREIARRRAEVWPHRLSDSPQGKAVHSAIAPYLESFTARCDRYFKKVSSLEIQDDGFGKLYLHSTLNSD